MDFAIFRIGKKYKSLSEIKGYQRHQEREQETPNADTTIENERLIGTPDITGDVERYIEGIKIRSNNVLARDLLLSASKEWFDKADDKLKEKWIRENVKWLKKEFKDNAIYAVAHKDELSLHISVLIVPKFHEEKRGHFLANRRYFNGRKALSDWQDKYAAAMEHLGLKRGIKWSKAKHTDVKQFYRLVNSELDEQNLELLCAKAKNSELLKVKVKELHKTLRIYEEYNFKSEEEKEAFKHQSIRLYKDLEVTRRDKEFYKECLQVISDSLKLPQDYIDKTFQSIADKFKKNDKNDSRDRG